MEHHAKPHTRGSPGHFAVYGERGVLREGVLAGMLETARAERSDWLVRSAYHMKALGDVSMRGLVTVLWPFGEAPVTKKPGYPVVNVSNTSGIRPGVGNLLSDDKAVGRMAAEFFHRKGVRDLLVLGIAGRVVHEERFTSAIEHAQTLGLTVQSFQHDFLGIGAEISSFVDYTEWLREMLFPTLLALPLGSGVFCTNDWLAQQILILFQSNFPEHLDGSSVLGVDNDAESDTYYGRQLPTLSSIEPAFNEMGREAFRWLSEHPGSQGAEQMAGLCRRFPPVRVIERASTAAGGCADPLTARMIRWAWERVQREESVSVTNMARAHHMHVKSLERRFQEHTGGNAVDLLARLKLNRAKSLLRETSLPIAEISSRCGYSKQDVLSRALRAAEGCTPREFRNRSREPASS